MAAAFLLFLALVTGAVGAAIWRFWPARSAPWVLAGLAIWLTYAGGLGFAGVIGNPAVRPPGPSFLLLPALLLVVFLARSAAGLRVAMSIPLAWLIGLQVFRVGVEVFLHQLWLAGLAPRMITYEGANFDIAIGLTAPIIAWLLERKLLSPGWALGWNILGLLMLANVVARALMTAPGAFHLLTSDTPNLAIGTFPFTYIPGFFVPLALVLHVLAIRALRIGLGPASSANGV